jgi:capsular exopolysaccharide synthesis family protein
LDQTFKDREEVEQFLKLPFLGVLPAIELENNQKHRRRSQSKQELQAESRVKDLYVFNHPKSAVAECSRAIRTNLLFMTPDKPFRSLLVSSSMAGEGKTTMTLNLATAMAQAGSRVLLVDADLRRPRVHKSFNVPNEVGLSSLLIEDLKLEQAVARSPIENLDILPCGPIPPNPSELLHTAKFKQVYADLLANYDKVIFDSAPISAVTDSVVLGTLVDGTLLVVKTGVTHREAVKRAVRSMQDAHANILGVVLNDLDAHRTEYGYSYSRYYWYGNYYYGYGEKTAA